MVSTQNSRVLRKAMLGDDHFFSIKNDKIPCRRGAARSLKKGTSCGYDALDM